MRIFALFAAAVVAHASFEAAAMPSPPGGFPGWNSESDGAIVAIKAKKKPVGKRAPARTPSAPQTKPAPQQPADDNMRSY